MIFNQILGLLETKTEKLATNWCGAIRKSEFMHSYEKLSDEELIRRHTRVLENLARWLERTRSRAEIGRFFTALGRERYQEGFPLCEVNHAMLLAKRGFWNLILSEGFFANALEVYQALELITSIHNFFDLGNFYIIRGYFEKMRAHLAESGKLSKSDLDRYICAGALLKEEMPLA